MHVSLKGYSRAIRRESLERVQSSHTSGMHTLGNQNQWGCRVWWRMYAGGCPNSSKSLFALFLRNSCGRGGKELVHVWLHCQPPSQQAFCPACQKSHLCAYNKKVTRNVKRVDYEAEAFELDPVEGSDVPVEGSESEDSKEEIDG